MKNNNKKFIAVLVMIISLAVSLVFPTIVGAATKKCAYKNCTRNAISGSSYCRTHTCSTSGCNNSVSSLLGELVRRQV